LLQKVETFKIFEHQRFLSIGQRVPSYILRIFYIQNNNYLNYKYQKIEKKSATKR